jgi:hypothetical protein
MPVAVHRAPTALTVDWCNLGDLRFTDPFFHQTVGRALTSPARMVFRRETPVDFPGGLACALPGLTPSGFIFHMSRCGSTLVSQMLAALPRNIVISEPPALNQLLRLSQGSATAMRAGWVRGLVNAWSRPRNGAEDRFFLKFDSWHIRELPLIVEAFPEVPWIFLYRDPIEVMVSHRRMPGVQMVPNMLDPRRLGLDPASIERAKLSEHCARVLSQLFAAALEFFPMGRGRLVNYIELPEAVTGSIARHFGSDFTAPERAKMAEVTTAHAKNPKFAFAPDSAEKQREASEEMRGLALKWLAEPYEQLERIRRQQSEG